MATGDYVYVLTDDSTDPQGQVLGAWVRKYEAVRWVERNLPRDRASVYTVTTVRHGSVVVSEEDGLSFLQRNRA